MASSTTTACSSNPLLVDLQRTKHLTADLLMTYLVSPGTAVYIGYTDGYDNVAIDPQGVRGFIQPDYVHRAAVLRQDELYLFRF